MQRYTARQEKRYSERYTGKDASYRAVRGIRSKEICDGRNVLKAHELGRLVQLVDHAADGGMASQIVAAPKEATSPRASGQWGEAVGSDERVCIDDKTRRHQMAVAGWL